MQWFKNLFKKKMYKYVVSYMYKSLGDEHGPNHGYHCVILTMRSKLSVKNYDEIVDYVEKQLNTTNLILVNLTYIGTSYETKT